MFVNVMRVLLMSKWTIKHKNQSNECINFNGTLFKTPRDQNDLFIIVTDLYRMNFNLPMEKQMERKWR